MSSADGPGGADRASDPSLSDTADSAGAGQVASTRDTPRAPRLVIAQRFEVRAELGRGAFGVVYRAFDAVSREHVAIKVIANTSPQLAERTRRELRAARRVTHPNVVRVHDIVEDCDRFVLSMELIDGTTLDRVLAAPNRLAGPAALRMAREIVAGVAAAHAVGLIHRDLKPANVMVRSDTGSCLVADFGVARPIERAHDLDQTIDGELVGTPLYMAPEQLAGSTDLAATVDVYALGLIIHEMVTGARPHVATSLAALAVLRAEAPAPLLATTRTLAEVVSRCLAPDPADRYPDARALLTALEHVDNDARAQLSVSVPAVTVAGAGAASRRWWWLAGVAATIVVTVVTVLAVEIDDACRRSADASQRPAHRAHRTRRMADTRRRRRATRAPDGGGRSLRPPRRQRTLDRSCHRGRREPRRRA